MIVDEIRAMKNRLAELEADKRRLDWVTENRANVAEFDSGGWYIETQYEAWLGSTPREAIDKAMSAKANAE